MQVEVILLKGVDSVTCSVHVVNFGQDVATVKSWLPYPTVGTGAAVSWKLPC